METDSREWQKEPRLISLFLFYFFFIIGAVLWVRGGVDGLGLTGGEGEVGDGRARMQKG